jgi:REP element-mobilizing transposase RayT
VGITNREQTEVAYMQYNSDVHHRTSIRLQGYDYSQSGGYFITICTKDRECLFGEIKNGIMMLNEHGLIAQEEWVKTGKMRRNIIMDEFVIMPNHIHGIIVINSSVGAYRNTPLQSKFQSPSNNLEAIIRGYKSSVTTRINTNRQIQSQSIWQRNYYEHIVRNDEDLNRVREYIINNPQNWEKDDLYLL